MAELTIPEGPRLPVQPVFTLSDDFVATYASRTPPFGFNGLGELVYLRTYSRIKEDGTQEAWHETVRRVVEGTYTMQKRWIMSHHLGWSEEKARVSAEEMYDRIWNMKFLPPGRGLWAMGSPLTMEKGLYAALNNPLHEDTRLLTKEYGWVALKDVEGQSVTVLTNTKLYGRDNGEGSAASPTWQPATISTAEHHPALRITYQSKFGDTYSVVSSENHRWFRKTSTAASWERVSALELQVGDWMPRTAPVKNYKICYQGAAHGFFFGDGTRANGELHQFTEENRQVLRDLFPRVYAAASLDSGLEHEVARQCPLAWAEIPAGQYVKDPRYVYGFLAGYFAADGSLAATGQMKLSSARQAELVAVKDLFTTLGIRTSDIRLASTSSNFATERKLYEMRIDVNDVQRDFFLKPSQQQVYDTLSSRAQDWMRITAIEPVDGLQRVLCATVPHYEQFVIEGWALTSNCGFVSTSNLDEDLAEPFTWLMDASMLGIGVGFDTEGAGTLVLHQPTFRYDYTAVYLIPDTREGWVESVRLLLESYFVPGRVAPIFDYEEIRPEGSPIKGFGGVASGPGPLRDLHEAIRGVLTPCIGQPISVTNIVDIMNLIGKCVVAGNVRRTAEIAFGAKDSEEFLDLKNYEVNPHRASYGWTSNNSIYAELGMDYTAAAARVKLNGEPGFVWLENMQGFGRMADPENYKDWRVAGANPCVEQSLESYELCCLVETFPANHDSFEDFRRTLKFAYLYAKTVTLGNTPWAKTNRVLLRNRRIGLSQSGIQQVLSKIGIDEYRYWCEIGYATVQHYDQIYSEWLAIPRSIKTTSVKPSGSVSLLAGATPGMHWPEARTYIRRMRLSIHSDLLDPLWRAGYDLEPAVGSENSTLVVEIPVRIEEPIRTAAEVSMWEQLSMAAFLQKYWSDNQVSATITFDPKTEGDQIAHALTYFQYQLKGISFLPRTDFGAYPQMPYEAITEDEYLARSAALLPLQFGTTHDAAEQERFCSNDSCTI